MFSSQIAIRDKKEVRVEQPEEGMCLWPLKITFYLKGREHMHIILRRFTSGVQTKSAQRWWSGLSLLSRAGCGLESLGCQNCHVANMALVENVTVQYQSDLLTMRFFFNGCKLEKELESCLEGACLSCLHKWLICSIMKRLRWLLGTAGLGKFDSSSAHCSQT